jgi:hypothetical protein
MKTLTDIADVYLLQEQIVTIEIKPGAELDVKEIKELHEQVWETAGKKKYGLLIESGFGSTITPDARAFAASEEKLTLRRIAKAFVVDNLAHKLVGNFYINFNKPVTPTKLFTDKKKAIEWLQEKVEEYNKLNSN